MARVLLLKTSPTGGRREVFVVDQAVGAGAPNNSQDVFLVRFFLRVASETVGRSAGFQPPGEPPLAIDGIFGKQTQNYISFYQNEVNRREGKKFLQPDGRIDRVPPGQLVGSINQTLFTILDLNVAFRTRRGDTTKIETDPLFPKALDPSFFLD